jgi:signal transduction histidine kinase
MFAVDETLCIIAANQQLADCTGYAAEQLPGYPLDWLTFEPAAPGRWWEGSRDGAPAAMGTVYLRHRDGQALPVALSGCRLHSQGRTLALFTALPQAESTSQQPRLDQIVGALPDLLFCVDKEGQILFVHAPDKGHLLQPAGQLLGQLLSKVMPARMVDSVHFVLQAALTTGVIQSYSYTLFIANRRRMYEARLVPMGPERVLAVVRDTTGQQDEERGWRDLLSQAAHELRTPLTSMTLLLEMLEGEIGAPSKLTTPLWEKLYEVVQHQMLLVEKLSTVARIESGRFTIQPVDLDVNGSVRAAFARFQPRAADKNVTLTLNLPDEPLWVRGDTTYLPQLFLNLLDNAVKYTPPGGAIQVTVALESELARITVQDTGGGIPPEDLPTLFHRYYRSRRAVAEAAPGMGVGLYLVYHIVRALGGDVAIESTPGVGTAVTVLLSCAG